MDNSNKRKAELLGEPFGTASHKLRKMILFRCIQKLGEDICFRCGEKIEKLENLSIEHKISWQKSDTPKELFYDLENISFSHLKCNMKFSEKRVPKPNIRKEKHGRAKLNEKDVSEIRKSGSPKTAIWKIKNNITWKN